MHGCSTITECEKALCCLVSCKPCRMLCKCGTVRYVHVLDAAAHCHAVPAWPLIAQHARRLQNLHMESVAQTKSLRVRLQDQSTDACMSGRLVAGQPSGRLAGRQVEHADVGLGEVADEQLVAVRGDRRGVAHVAAIGVHERAQHGALRRDLRRGRTRAACLAQQVPHFTVNVAFRSVLHMRGQFLSCHMMRSSKTSPRTSTLDMLAREGETLTT